MSNVPIREGKTEVEEKNLFNLVIAVRCYKTTFNRMLIHSVEDEIEAYGMAIHRAKKMLGGKWRVAERGRLLRGFAPNVEHRIAQVEIDDMMPGLALLEKVLAGSATMRENACRVHLHFEKTQGIAVIGADAEGLYLE